MSGSAQAYDVHSPIIILDNTDLVNAGFPGTGTEADPFLIQNYEIDGAGGSAIAIYYTDLHVKIRNCLLSDSSSPSAVIHLEGVQNVSIENNHLIDSYVGVGLINSNDIVIRNNTFENHNTGIVLDNSDYNVLFNNTCVLDVEMPSGRAGIQMISSDHNCLGENNCSGNNDGINLRSSNFSTLVANTCDNNDGDGISIDSSINNTVTANICRGNSIGGIVLYSSSSVTTGNEITSNTCSGNGLVLNWGAGILLFSSTTYPMSNNTISNNELSGNYHGIWVLNSASNNIASNTIHGNQISGIYLDSTSNCNVSSNTIYENGDSGVWLDKSSGCTVKFNTVWNNFNGTYLYDSDNNVLSNNELLGNTFGVYLGSSSYNTINDNNCSDSVGGDGIQLLTSDFNRLLNNTANDNVGQRGIFLFTSNSNTMLDNTCNGNSDGISIYSTTIAFSNYNIIHNNTCSGNTNVGIRVQDRSSNTVITNNTCNNTCIDNTYGVQVIYSDHCTIANNTCTGNNIGIYLMSEWDVVDHNNCSGNAQAGIYLISSNLNVVSNNICGHNGQGLDYHGGIVIDTSNENTLSDNNCSLNGGHGVFLKSSNDNEITNSICLDNSGNGIHLSSSEQNNLSNNTCASPNLFYGSANVGIFLDWSDHNNMTNNDCFNNGDGLYLRSSYYNTVSGNNLSYNNNYMGTGRNIKVDSSFNQMINNTCLGASYGISIFSGSDIRIEGNTFSYNTGAGIEVYSTNDHERYVIANNTCNGNGYGIYLSWVSDSTITNNTCEDNGKVGIYFDKRAINNLVSNNTIKNNGYQLVDDGYGMAFAGHGLAIDGTGEYDKCYDNIIANNTIEGSRLHGINITSATGNILFGNVLIRNNGATSEFDTAHVQAYDNGANFWNGSANGNLWGDWTSPDANGDGIVDQAYLIDGGTNKDLLPLAVSVAITSPVDWFATSETNVEISGTAVSYFGVAQVTWYNSATDGSGTCIGTEGWNATIVLVEGENLITITTTDLSGNQADATVTLVLDAIPPTLEITFPAEGAITGSSVTVTWTGSDGGSGISHYNISVDGGVWMTVTSPHVISALVQGGHVIIVRAFDLVGNSASATVNITVDVTSPNVEILAPAEGYPNTTGSVTITWTGNDTDSGIDHYEVSRDEMAPVNVSAGTSTYTFTGLSDGSHTFTVLAVNMVGLTSQDQVNVVVDTLAPSLTITAPSPGSFMNVNIVIVNWAADDAGVGIANFTISIDGAASILLDASNRSYQFNALSNGPHTVVITATDQLGHSTNVTRIFTVDTIAPTLNIEGPEDGAYFNVTTVALSWSTYDANPGEIRISLDDGPWTTATGEAFELNSLGIGQHTVRVNVTDRASNFNESSVQFTVDTDAPTVKMSSPNEGSYSTANITGIEWEANDNGSGIALTEVSLNGTNWTVVIGTFYATSPQVDGPVTVQVRVTDRAGNSAKTEVNFTVDTLTPTAEVSPAGNWVAVDSPIVVQFSEQMNISSVIIDPVGITGSISWGGTAATFRQIAPLMYGRQYTVEVTGQDLAGNEMSLSWNFTTVSMTYFVGTAEDVDGDPLGGARVTINNGTVSESQVTGADGTFIFGFVGNVTGLFTVSLEKDGYLDVTVENITYDVGGTEDLGLLTMTAEPVEDGEDNTTMYILVLIVVMAAAAIAAIFLKKKK